MTGLRRKWSVHTTGRIIISFFWSAASVKCTALLQYSHKLNISFIIKIKAFISKLTLFEEKWHRRLSTALIFTLWKLLTNSHTPGRKWGRDSKHHTGKNMERERTAAMGRARRCGWWRWLDRQMKECHSFKLGTTDLLWPCAPCSPCSPICRRRDVAIYSICTWIGLICCRLSSCLLGSSQYQRISVSRLVAKDLFQV